MSDAKDADNRLELALKASNEGVWDWDLVTDEIFFTNRVLRFLGCGRFDAPNFIAKAQDFVHGDDYPAWKRKMDDVFCGGNELFAMEARVKTFEGPWKWFRVRAVPRRDEAGTVVRLVGSIIDISKRKNAEAELEEERARLDLLLENVPVNVYLKDRDSRFIKVNRSTAERMGGGSPEEMIGKTDHDFFRAEHADESRQMELRIMETRKGQLNEMEHEVWEDGRESWVMVTKMPWIGIDGDVKGTFGVTNDVTELVETENRLAEMAATLAGVNQAIEEERHRLRLVIDNIPMFVYFKDRESNFVLVNQGMVDLIGVGTVDDLIGKHDRDFFSPDHYEVAWEDEKRVMETGVPLASKLERIAWKDGHITWVISAKYPWYDQNGELVGTFGVSGDVTDLVKTRNQLVELAKVLTRKNDSMEEELRLAKEVQQAAIPKHLPIIGHGGRTVRFDHRYEPASGLAGDFFEVIKVDESVAAFLVCDVMGHGVRAALVVSMLRGLMEKGHEARHDPALFLGGLNEGLCHLLERTGITMFSTAIYGVVDLKEGTLRVASAGHPDPLVKLGGEIEALVFGGDKGPALGLVPGVDYGERELSLDDCSGMWLFTDGIFEVQDEEGKEFGVERMVSALKKCQETGAVVEEARAYAAGGKFDDDVCIVGLELLDSSATEAPR
ncbi:MAG: PAS domain S-box protein [Verrucomicrobiaceae bacterium]